MSPNNAQLELERAHRVNATQYSSTLATAELAVDVNTTAVDERKTNLEAVRVRHHNVYASPVARRAAQLFPVGVITTLGFDSMYLHEFARTFLPKETPSWMYPVAGATVSLLALSSSLLIAAAQTDDSEEEKSLSLSRRLAIGILVAFPTTISLATSSARWGSFPEMSPAQRMATLALALCVSVVHVALITAVRQRAIDYLLYSWRNRQAKRALAESEAKFRSAAKLARKAYIELMLAPMPSELTNEAIKVAQGRGGDGGGGGGAPPTAAATADDDDSENASNLSSTQQAQIVSVDVVGGPVI